MGEKAAGVDGAIDSIVTARVIGCMGAAPGIDAGIVGAINVVLADNGRVLAARDGITCVCGTDVAVVAVAIQRDVLAAQSLVTTVLSAGDAVVANKRVTSRETASIATRIVDGARESIVASRCVVFMATPGEYVTGV